jgi:hypothetical protein
MNFWKQLIFAGFIIVGILPFFNLTCAQQFGFSIGTSYSTVSAGEVNPIVGSGVAFNGNLYLKVKDLFGTSLRASENFSGIKIGSSSYFFMTTTIAVTADLYLATFQIYAGLEISLGGFGSFGVIGGIGLEIIPNYRIFIETKIEGDLKFIRLGGLFTRSF